MITERKTAVVTGASSGIGAATARALAEDGWHVVLAARRTERIEKLAEEIGGTAVTLDVTDQESVDHLADLLPRVDLLVNNAGGAKGLAPLQETAIEDWQWMFDVNVLGTVRMTTALLEKLREAEGLIVNVGSKAGLDPYVGGSAYNAAKFGVRALTRAQRLEEIEAGAKIRITEIAPGRVDTEEFSLVRFGGDEAKARAVYQDKVNVLAEDVAEAIRWVASLPKRVNIDTMNIMPRDQG
ncbi:SDR family NAD(P)-dependent oxidoreductase [Corynebacterium guangdongense]|uniref:NADP-dependent 3-hydroxy acid dehydrogenase YdfG n=1 Tax=Corynebacterium guangdongense TaxID=1783348 RepID=A0ABU2A0K9_9CORY|nr:SDR family oxidoreductase [Corynebacterium guangdongense]MDR7330721.1 NADP-dependent 3-hydroxy acid dehydrogenase YdfG [Corynebacterium guangdongense]WJZ16736.1 Serine 3-dehydrogenase [Corynebacterium guangdongense]